MWKISLKNCFFRDFSVVSGIFDLLIAKVAPTEFGNVSKDSGWSPLQNPLLQSSLSCLFIFDRVNASLSFMMSQQHSCSLLGLYWNKDCLSQKFDFRSWKPVKNCVSWYVNQSEKSLVGVIVLNRTLHTSLFLKYSLSTLSDLFFHYTFVNSI